MKWPWIVTKEVVEESKQHKREIEKVKRRLDRIERVDVIAEQLAVFQREDK